MVRQSSREPHHPAEHLASRHIFLDTQVYRAFGHNPANRALALLKEQVNSHLVVLHTTDITLMEVQRQIRERVLARQRELMVIERDLAQ
jgi:PIN domain